MLNAEQVRTCAWIHMWPGETREKVLLVLNDLINATEAESRTDAEKIEAQSEQCWVSELFPIYRNYV